MLTHDDYVKAIHSWIIGHSSRDDGDKLRQMKLAYGVGNAGIRGVTIYGAWHNGQKPVDFVEISASGEESPCQLAGTTVHECGHVCTQGDGHGKIWKAKTAEFGLRNPKAAGHSYCMAGFEADLRHYIASLGPLTDGKPQLMGSGLGGLGLVLRHRPCGAGIGVRGGKSRGIGSGSRLRKYVCGCEPAVIIRAASDHLACTCDHCATSFHIV